MKYDNVLYTHEVVCTKRGLNFCKHPKEKKDAFTAVRLKVIPTIWVDFEIIFPSIRHDVQTLVALEPVT